MKKWFVFIALITLTTLINAVPYVSPLRFMEIPFATEMVMDGLDSETGWSTEQSVSLFNNSGWTGSSDFEGSFRVCWDPDYLYLYADITDEYNHSFDPSWSDVWMFDCVEVYLDLDTADHPSTAYDDNTIQLRFNRGLTQPTAAGRANPADYIYYYEEKGGGDGWILEVAIPWTCAMPSGSLPEDINDYVSYAMGFDVLMSDSDNSDGDVTIGNRDVQAAWDEDGLNGTEDLAWMNTSVFGVVELMAEPGVPAIPYVEPVRTMEKPARNDRIVLDGIDDETSWSEEQDVSLFYTAGYSGASDFDAVFRLTWDMEYLYFFADITDDVEHDYQAGLTNAWMFDNVEFFIDLDTLMGTTNYDDNTIQLRFCRGPVGVETSGRAEVSEFRYYWENKAGGDGWIIESAIPWTCVMPDGYDPEDFQYYVSKMIGLDINYADSDNSDGNASNGNRDVQAAWDADGLDGTEDLAWNNTHVFGIVDLIGDPLPPEPDPVGLPYYQPVMEVDVPVKSGNFTADGLDNEAFWSYKQSLTVFNEGNYTGDDDLAGGFRTAWDHEYLYLYVTVTDDMDRSWSTGETEAEGLFDNLEVFIDLDTFCLDPAYRSNSTVMLRFNRGMDEVQTPGRAGTGEFIYATTEMSSGQGWIVEVAVPWKAALATGSDPEDIEDYLPVIGFDMMITDRDNESSPAHTDLTLAAWDPDGEGASAPYEYNVYTDTRSFGLANLSPYIVPSEGQSLDPGIRMYPNPASHEVYFEDLQDVQRLDILDINGRILYSYEDPSGDLRISVTDFSRGIYLVRMIMSDGRVVKDLLAIEE